MSFSKIAKKCNECSFKNICNKKKIVADAGYPSTVNNAKRVSQPNAIAYTPVTINLGDSGQVQISLEDLKKQMLEDFYKKSGLGISID